MAGITGNGGLADQMGFFDGTDGPLIPLPYEQRIPPPDEYRTAVQKALNGKYIHDGIRSYAERKAAAVFDPYLAFDKHLDDYNTVMRYLTKVAENGMPEDQVGIVAALRSCRVYETRHRMCGFRFCPICRMENILMRLDYVARTLHTHSDRSIIRFITFLDTFTYTDGVSDTKQAWEASRTKIDNRMYQGRHKNPEVYRSLSLILHGEWDQVQSYRQMVGLGRLPHEKYKEMFASDDKLMPRKRDTLLRLGFLPGVKGGGELITWHGLVFCPSEDHYRVLESDLQSGNHISRKAVYPHPHQMLFKSLFENRGLLPNIKRIVAYMLKAKPYYANYISKSGDAEADALAEEMYIPFYERRLSDHDMGWYVNLCRKQVLSFQNLTLTSGVPKRLARSKSV